MNERTYFLNMFSDYEPPEELVSVLSQAAIVAADIDPETRRVSAAVHSEQYIPMGILEGISREISGLYGLRDLELVATHPAHELQKVQPEELMQLFVRCNSMTRGSLAGARWAWEENTLTIHLRANGKAMIEECVPKVQRNLQERFGVAVNIRIEAGETLEGSALFEAMDKMRSSAMARWVVNMAAGSIPIWG